MKESLFFILRGSKRNLFRAFRLLTRSQLWTQWSTVARGGPVFWLLWGRYWIQYCLELCHIHKREDGHQVQQKGFRCGLWDFYFWISKSVTLPSPSSIITIPKYSKNKIAETGKGSIFLLQLYKHRSKAPDFEGWTRHMLRNVSFILYSRQTQCLVSLCWIESTRKSNCT